MTQPNPAASEPLVAEPIRKLLAEVLLFFHDCSDSIRCIDRVVDLEERIGAALAAPAHQAAEPAPADKLRAEMQTLGYSDTAINAMGDSTTMMQRAIDARKMLMAAAPPTPTPALPDEVARTDTERLDWIERKVCDVSRLGDSARTVRIAWNNGADHVDIGPHCHANWRVAIDAAIAAQEAKS